jgi:hypothetical protein
MRLATIRTPGGTRAVRVDDDAAVEVGAVDVAELLHLPDWRSVATAANGARHKLDGLDYAPVVPARSTRVLQRAPERTIAAPSFAGSREAAITAIPRGANSASSGPSAAGTTSSETGCGGRRQASG